MKNLSRQKLSVVIPVKDAQDKIENCLKSIAWADEIIVIDTGSQDRTIEICRKYTDKVFYQKIAFKEEKKLSGLSEIRTLGNNRAAGDWILQLDADEVVTEEFKKEINRILRAPDLPFAAHQFTRKNFFLGKPLMHGGWYHHCLRFFKKGKAQYEGGLIHEKLVVNGKINTLDVGVEHYPFDSFSQFIERQNLYSTMTAKELFNKNPNLSTRQLLYHLIIKPLKLFWKMYVKKKGYKDGKLSLIFCLLYSWLHLVIYAKYWELTRQKRVN